MFYRHSPAEAELFNYLDDFLFAADSQQHCEETLSCFVNFCEQMSVPVAAHKTERPTKSIVLSVLSIGIKAASMSIFIPEEKKVKM